MYEHIHISMYNIMYMYIHAYACAQKHTLSYTHPQKISLFFEEITVSEPLEDLVAWVLELGRSCNSMSYTLHTCHIHV